MPQTLFERMSDSLDKPLPPVIDVRRSQAKVDHVRAALRDGQTHGHTCHWPGCDKRVPPAAWGCRPHWYKLPKAIRNRIWAAYRQGQEDSKTPSRVYIDAAREAQEWIAANAAPDLYHGSEGHEA